MQPSVDALSRLTKIEDPFRSQDNDEYVRMVASHATPVALRIKEVEQASAQDSEPQATRKCLIDGKWDSVTKQNIPVRSELTFIGQVILRYKHCYALIPSKESGQSSTRRTPGGHQNIGEAPYKGVVAGHGT